ncbi:ABC transporter substrate-binding protein [Pseudolysinimonas sp.]|uniref:ABC transporter substrate-binding protein n=1 Tax=Pseudolysinimonas sp. TaxID=2680009 RepID=UPI003F812B43
MRKSLRAAAIAVVAAAGLVLAACSGQSGSGDGKVVHLTYWTWAPGIAKITQQWNKTHPDIQVKVVQAAGADDILAKLLAAERAGNGPDIAAAEYQKLPNLVVSGAAADITSEVGAIKKDYTASTWQLATVGGKVYGIPQDTAPMVLMYRADLFQKYGLELPKTWDDYAALAAKVKQVAPSAFLGGYPDDGSTFAGYTQPLKDSAWYSTDGKSWKVGIDDAANKRVADFWQPLVEKGLVDTTHFFTPEWNTEMNNGTLLTWTAGVWAPGTIESVAPDTKGDWRIAPMPSWDGEQQVGFMGGSTAMVTKTSKHPKEAVEFLSWLNASKDGASRLAVGGLFPASIPGQESLSGLSVPPIVEGQDDFWTVAQHIAKHTAKVTWGPNVQVAYDTYADAIKAATTNKTPYADALTKTQDAVVADLKKTGFTVTK